MDIMYNFYCNLVTLKHGDAIGDFVGVVIEDEMGNKKAISLEELEILVAEEKIDGFKLETYHWKDMNGNVMGSGNMVFFEDGKPLLLDKVEWHKNMANDKSVEFSDKVKEMIENSHYR